MYKTKTKDNEYLTSLVLCCHDKMQFDAIEDTFGKDFRKHLSIDVTP